MGMRDDRDKDGGGMGGFSAGCGGVGGGVQMGG